MDLWTIGFADRLRFPRFAAQSGEMLVFAHNSTGSINNRDLEIDREGDCGPAAQSYPAVHLCGCWRRWDGGGESVPKVRG
jgi:hypothetical protein